ncbi:hypothetical protein PPUJ20005_08320 [Pseudomonas putida]|uniref:Uncharacterized protein n=1 Tax=Pseudomonas putida NBRC 14164 TaxID=1211579 RepID=A0ABM7EC93_PSEPU|nr:hypothetical protein PP4_13470 [Pseudomonas putida NBRC 14164]GLO06864.1 hypothetical protein PPUJ20005_08320 [Pseudomonas putida]GLO23869.1 hypothetical protein PPUJ21368_16970 [Pseudomonas putida]
MNGLAIDGRVCLLLKTAGPARNEIDGVGVHEKARLLWMGGRRLSLRPKLKGCAGEEWYLSRGKMDEEGAL